MGRGTSKAGGGAGGAGSTGFDQEAVSNAITDFLTSYGRKSIQVVTSLGGYSSQIPTRSGGVLGFSLSQSKTPDSVGNTAYYLSSNGY